MKNVPITARTVIATGSVVLLGTAAGLALRAPQGNTADNQIVKSVQASVHTSPSAALPAGDLHTSPPEKNSSQSTTTIQSQLQLNATTSNSDSATPSVKMTLNGHHVAIPKNGSAQQTINNSNGDTTIHVSSSSNTSTDTSGSSNTSTDIQLYTDTQTGDTTASGP